MGYNWQNQDMSDEKHITQIIDDGSSITSIAQREDGTTVSKTEEYGGWGQSRESAIERTSSAALNEL